MNVYIPSVVKSIREFYGSLLFDIEVYSSVLSHLEALAERLWQGIQNEESAIIPQVNNYNKKYLGLSAEFIFGQKLSFEDARSTIAHEYGFDNWLELQTKTNVINYNFGFEKAVNDLLAGNLTELKSNIDSNPILVSMRSPYKHNASLLHYVGNNGVEFWRQVIPDNLLEITQFLLEAGADKSALMNVYGGEFTTAALFETSTHPYETNMRDELLNILV